MDDFDDDRLDELLEEEEEIIRGNQREEQQQKQRSFFDMDDERLDEMIEEEEELLRETGPPEPYSDSEDEQQQAAFSSSSPPQPSSAFQALGDSDSDEEIAEERDRARSTTFLERLRYKRTLREQASQRHNSVLSSDLSSYVFRRPGLDGERGDFPFTLPLAGEMRYFSVDLSRCPYTSSSSFSSPSQLTTGRNRETAAANLMNLMGVDREQGLLERPIREMERELEELEYERAMRESQLSLGEEEEYAADDVEMEMDGNKQQTPKEKLLAQKYDPKGFFDLVSHERNNRDVMRWVNGWKDFVFHKKMDTRPSKLLILLCGPPGAGKTTLAHTVAKHAGYNVVEINASDERTGPVLVNRIRNAMEMQSMFVSDKPNCIILDEFEGVASQGEGRGAVSALVEMVAAPLQQQHQQDPSKEAEDGKAKKKQKKNLTKGKNAAHPITRPIILICNDPYVKALRPIRRIAQVVWFKPVAQPRIVQRLKEVCAAESILPEHGALELLAECTDNDIRSALHTLDFLARQVEKKGARGVKLVKKDAVSKFCETQRDRTADYFRTMRKLFFCDRFANRRKPRSKLTSSSASLSRHDRHELHKNELTRMLETHLSDFPTVLDGIYENMLHNSLTDSGFANLNLILDTLSDCDMMLQRIHRKGEWELSPYLPVLCSGLESHCKTETRSQIQYPSLSGSLHRRVQESTEIVELIAEGGAKLGIGPKRSVILDVASPLLDIMNPHVRAVPWNLLNPKEKASVQNTVESLSAVGITMVQVLDDAITPSGMVNPFQQAVYRPDPRVDKLVTFGKQSPFDGAHTLPAWTTCGIIAHRVKLETIRAGGSKLAHKQFAGEVKPKKVTNLREKDSKASKGVKQRVPTDFFGRPLAHSNSKKRVQAEQGGSMEQDDASKDHEEDAALSKRKRDRVVYRFNEGLTDAIRRPVFLKDLLS